jgi:hypothetical protein
MPSKISPWQVRRYHDGREHQTDVRDKPKT